MIHTDEDALICDLAETYGVLNFHMLPVSLLATLCCGLRDDARIIQKMTGSKLSTDTALLAMMTDRLNWLKWAKTQDGVDGRNHPESVYEHLQGIESKAKNKHDDVIVFDSVDSFEEALRRARGGA